MASRKEWKWRSAITGPAAHWRDSMRLRPEFVRMVPPNAITALGLCAGLFSLRMSFEGRFDIALAAIVVAALLDGLDGRLARMLHASSRFGAEFDSLADFLNFGVAPIILLFMWGDDALDGFGWFCLMVFALASALRLARFNAHLDEAKPSWKSGYFTGMPTPIAAVAVLLPIYLASSDGTASVFEARMLPFYTLLIAFLMVSNIPNYSGKGFSDGRSRSFLTVLQVVLATLAICLTLHPRATLTAATLAYLLSVPFSWMSYKARSASSGDELLDHASGDKLVDHST